MTASPSRSMAPATATPRGSSAVPRRSAPARPTRRRSPLADARAIFVARYDTGGALVSATSAGGPGADAGSGIAIDDAGNSYAHRVLPGLGDVRRRRGQRDDDHGHRVQRRLRREVRQSPDRADRHGREGQLPAAGQSGSQRGGQSGAAPAGERRQPGRGRLRSGRDRRLRQRHHGDPDPDHFRRTPTTGARAAIGRSMPTRSRSTSPRATARTPACRLPSRPAATARA